MPSFNRSVLVGNLTKDPELKQVGGGTVCRLSMASNRQFKNKQGGLTQEVCYIDVDVWGPQAESCHKYLRSGSPVLVEGRLKFDSWKDAEGKTRSRHSIVAVSVVFLGVPDSSVEDEKPNAAHMPVGSGASKVSLRSSSKQDAAPVIFEDEPPFADDLPF